ncbi:hypothetical protein SAY87_009873 [Trapa incisa]|uniref:Disease resistance R13L4/SHOC-2-like LRR domain-containing protein n=1 Tax=Trapa incisa TaxID=236973 RepID=A0AAN7JYC4_9MYRT|nr:hypothetical protein SAY87_009873 [Trapa incisa]
MAKLASSFPVPSVSLLLLVLSVIYLPRQSSELELSQFQALLRLQQLLNYPPSLNSFFNTSDFSDIVPTQSFTLVCFGDDLTQLHINGQDGAFPLPSDFSTQAFFSTLATFSSLKVLSLVSMGLQGPLPAAIGNLSSLEILNASSNSFTGEIPEEISSLKGLQSLILDFNNFTGQIPGWLGSHLPAMAVLSLKNNSLAGTVPGSFSSMRNLRVLSVSGNNLSGEIPNLQRLHNLQVLDLEGNQFGPHFPSLPTRLVTLILKKNKFGLGLPSKSMAIYYQLQKLDVSMNGFVGPFLPFLLSLPSIQYLDISANKFTGMLQKTMSCSPGLIFVNLSSNLLTGYLPSCLLSESHGQRGEAVLYADNCISGQEDQHPSGFCHNEALAVTILPTQERHTGPAHKAGLTFSVLGGTLGGVAIVASALLAARKVRALSYSKSPPTMLVIENASAAYNVKLLSDAS